MILDESFTQNTFRGETNQSCGRCWRTLSPSSVVTYVLFLWCNLTIFCFNKYLRQKLRCRNDEPVSQIIWTIVWGFLHTYRISERTCKWFRWLFGDLTFFLFNTEKIWINLCFLLCACSQAKFPYKPMASPQLLVSLA